MLEGFGEGLAVRGRLEHLVEKHKNMEKHQGWTLEGHLGQLYISAQYAQGNAASSGPRERRGSKTCSCPPPSSPPSFLTASRSFSSSAPPTWFLIEPFQMLIRAQNSSWKLWTVIVVVPIKMAKAYQLNQFPDIVKRRPTICGPRVECEAAAKHEEPPSQSAIFK